MSGVEGRVRQGSDPSRARSQTCGETLRRAPLPEASAALASMGCARASREGRLLRRASRNSSCLAMVTLLGGLSPSLAMRGMARHLGCRV